MATTRSQSQVQAQAMSTPQAAEATQESDRESLLSPGWVHTITIVIGHSLKSEIGQKLQ